MGIKLSEGITYRIIDGEAVICNIRTGAVLLLNKTASYVLDLIKKYSSLDKVIKSYSKYYECSEAEAEEDIKQLLEQLKIKKIVVF